MKHLSLSALIMLKILYRQIISFWLALNMSYAIVLTILYFYNFITVYVKSLMLILLLFITVIYCYNWSHTLINNVSPNSLDVTFDALNNPIILYNYNIGSTFYLKYHRCLDRTCSNYTDHVISKYNSDRVQFDINHPQMSIKVNNNKVHIVYKKFFQ